MVLPGNNFLSTKQNILNILLGGFGDLHILIN